MLQVRIYDAQTKIPRGGPDSLNLVFVAFPFRRVRQRPHRALVNRAAGRLGHPASIPRAIMSRSPEALALGPAVISFRRRYHCPSAGAFLTGLATAVDPASRRGSRVGAMLTLLRLPLSAPCASLPRFSASPTGLSAALKGRLAGRHPIRASILVKKTAVRMLSPFRPSA